MTRMSNTLINCGKNKEVQPTFLGSGSCLSRPRELNQTINTFKQNYCCVYLYAVRYYKQSPC